MAEPFVSACVVPIVEGSPPRILWARRGRDAPALEGFHVAPGGIVDRADPSAEVTALRELFEEVGILWADGAERLDEAAQRELRNHFRDDVHEGHARFAAMGLSFRTRDLVPIGRWVTPSFVTRRYDTTFFALRMPQPTTPEPDLFEIDEAEWIEAPRALARWSRAEVLLGPPLAILLRSLSRHGALRPERLTDVRGAMGEECQRWEVVPWVQMLALRTPTLPPATHTNSYLVGSRRAVLVEPATPYADELDRMCAWVREARSAGIEPFAIIATHHHADHVGGARELSARLSLPLWAHRGTAERLAGQLSFERLLEDGERIELDGPDPIVLRVLHTPGHAPGHVCLLEESSGAMIAGDMVAGEGTILIEPRDGDMAEYLCSLRRMADEGPTVLLPAHGSALRDSASVLAHYIEHRLLREAKVLAALRDHGGPASPIDLVPRAYDDAPRVVWPLAALSTEAHLLKLLAEGSVRRDGAGWCAA